MLEAEAAHRICVRLMEPDPSGQTLFRSVDILWNLLENGSSSEVAAQLNNLTCIRWDMATFISYICVLFSGTIFSEIWWKYHKKFIPLLIILYMFYNPLHYRQYGLAFSVSCVMLLCSSWRKDTVTTTANSGTISWSLHPSSPPFAQRRHSLKSASSNNWPCLLHSRKVKFELMKIFSLLHFQEK